MFQSPSIRLYTSENAENMVTRKPGNLQTRKPFLDRSVNSKTPDTTKLQKPKLNFAKCTPAAEKSKPSPKLRDDIDDQDFIYSFKDVEDCYEDILPKSQRLSTENLVKILRNYCKVEDTPPPSPEPTLMEINPIFFELPDLEKPMFQIDEDFLMDKPFDVDVPYFDETELDASV